MIMATQLGYICLPVGIHPHVYSVRANGRLAVCADWSSYIGLSLTPPPFIAPPPSGRFGPFFRDEPGTEGGQGTSYLIRLQKGSLPILMWKSFTYSQEINLVTSSSLFSPFPCISEKIRANTISGEEQSSGNGLQLVNIGFTYNPVNLLVYVRSLRTIPHQIHPFVGSTEVDGTCSSPWLCVSYTIRSQKQSSLSIEGCKFLNVL